MYNLPQNETKCVNIVKLEFSLKNFLKKLHNSRHISREKHILDVQTAIRSLENINCSRSTEEGIVRFGQKELDQISSDISEVIRIFNQSWSSLDSDKTNFLISLKLCQRVLQDYAADAYFQKQFLEYDQ
jgi:uncharacterized UPF0160 family protein